MKKILLVLAVSGMLLSACHSNNAGAKTDSAAAGPVMPNGPKFKFENDTHDFGKIKQGDKVTYKFNFVNVGKSPLIITNAVATCGCTQPEWPKEPIKPGDGGQITVTYNSTGHSGLQDKMITITANTNPAQSMVHLVGEVTK
ncbi:MAG: DUF1573 domain-containing protein [Mucilaginibacter sp.]